MDPNGLYDIYGMWHVPWWQRPLFLWTIAIVGSILILVLLSLVVKRFFFRKKPKKPWDIALVLLSQAHANADAQNFDVAQFYAQVTSVLKGYLKARYSYDLIGKTDAELLALIRERVEFPTALMPLLAGLLGRAEMIKFAKEEALLDQVHEDYALSLQIIRQTIPVEKKEQKS